MKWGYLAMGAVVLIWSTFALSIRAAGNTSLTPGDVALLRFGVPSLLLIPVIPKTIRIMRRQPWYWTVLIAIGGGFPFLMLVQLGGAATSAALVGTIPPGTIPVFITIFGAVLGTHFATARWFGIACIAAGVVVAMQGSGAAHLAGVGLLLTAGALWSLYVLAVSKTSYRPLDIVVLLAVPSSVMSGVFIETGLLHTTLFTGGAVLSEMLTYAVLQGVVIGIISTLLYSFAITNLGASRAALMGSVSPVLTTLGAIPLLGETPALGTVVCLVLVSAGVLTANLWGTAVPLTHTRSRLGARLRVKNAIV